MKTFKLLILTCALTLVLCASLFPVAAQPIVDKPSVQVVSYSQLSSSQANMDFLANKFTLSLPMKVSEELHQPINANNHHNNFFEAAVNFNEKLQQVIAFFSSSNTATKNINANNRQVDDAEAISNKKCKSN